MRIESVTHAMRPWWRRTAPQFPALVVEQIGLEVQRAAEFIDLPVQSRSAAGLVRLQQLVGGIGLDVLPERRLGLRAEHHGGQHDQGDNQRLRQPEGEKNSKEETFHREPLFTFSRGLAKIYPTPRTVLMCSVSPFRSAR
ncbi:MAG: hypothetical protein DMG81_07520, partial [Acidobacteria bacterium]